MPKIFKGIKTVLHLNRIVTKRSVSVLSYTLRQRCSQADDFKQKAIYLEVKIICM